MRFTKMHGLGNDYVYINAFEQQVPDPVSLAVRVSDRHFGIGSDGLILILPSGTADARMRIFNADGSEAEMCGNGLRCVAKFVYERGISRSNPMRIETGAGILTVDLFVDADDRVEKVRVDMGRPRLVRSEIPMTGPAGERAVEIPIEAGGQLLRATCVSMGNPHCVVFVDDVDAFPVTEVGPLLETHPMFPRRINVEFVQVLNRTEVRQRTWERGAGETLACGTGASAVTVAAVLTGRCERRIINHLAGGDLELEWLEDGPVLMTGPATEVFSGEFEA
ncbi:MAG: diaminopimelate epimerase [Deltaproteobacteria bacterium]|nr:MAG: diaminopimelate epimerase [Deltaproteobacteria bacterium]